MADENDRTHEAFAYVSPEGEPYVILTRRDGKPGRSAKLLFRPGVKTEQSVALAQQINEILTKVTFPLHGDV